ncbi:MAG: hypothetical protein WCV79_01860 [Candidatus Paceibacterota bacterium]
MNTQNLAVTIRQVVLHINAHLDEFLALFLLRTYGEECFPGIKTAAIRYSESDIKGSDEKYDRDGILPIGCGGGRFDEHTPEGERIEDETATTLVADYLGIESKSELTKLLNEAYTCDTQGRTNTTQLAEIIKAANRCHRQNGTNQVMQIAYKALAAIVNQEEYHFAATPGEKTLLEIFRAEVDKGNYSANPKVRATLFNLVHASMKAKDDRVTELAHIVECLYRHGHRDEDVQAWVEFVLCALETDQMEFQEQVEIAKQIRPIPVYVQQGVREERMRLLVVRSDSPLAQKAARYRGAEIILLAKSSGNYQIFIDKRIEGLNLANAIRMIRWLELPQGDKADANWLDLDKEGKLERVPHWYYFKRAEMIFNGSETHKVPPTEICTHALVEVLRHAFCYSRVKKWCNHHDRQINMN